MQNLLYNLDTVFGRIYRFFYSIFDGVSKPTRHTLSLFVISMIVMEGVDSVRNVFRGFMCGITSKSLNAVYYALSYAKVDYYRFANILAGIALSIIPGDLYSLPVFLCVDDTMVAKFGTKFDDVSVLFDHSAHNGSNFLNGHCFVTVSLCVPVWNREKKISYLSVPLGCRTWVKEGLAVPVSKLELSEQIIRRVMPCLLNKRNVIILCDSWYAKGSLFALTKDFDNLDLICNVRADTVLYGSVPPRTGKRGRPRVHGDRISLDDFALTEERVGDFHVGHKKVMTNLLKGAVIDAFVTSTHKEGGSRRLFLSTLSATDIEMFCAWYEKPPINQTGSGWFRYLPLMFYSVRWQGTEVGYYEQKTFWSFRKYMLRGHFGIERLLNLIIIAYSGVKLLPYVDSGFEEHKCESPQETRSFFARKIREQVFIAGFGESLEVNIKSYIQNMWLNLNILGKKVA